MGETLDWLDRSASWSGPDGIPTRLLEHVRYSGLAVLVAAVIALPVGLLIGHTGRGSLVAGIRSIDAGVRDAARGMGMTGRQALWAVEVPLAMPLILAGLRSAAGQVVATATIAAFVGLGGLGRYIIDGYSNR